MCLSSLFLYYSRKQKGTVPLDLHGYKGSYSIIHSPVKLPSCAFELWTMFFFLDPKPVDVWWRKMANHVSTDVASSHESITMATSLRVSMALWSRLCLLWISDKLIHEQRLDAGLGSKFILHKLQMWTFLTACLFFKWSYISWTRKHTEFIL